MTYTHTIKWAYEVARKRQHPGDPRDMDAFVTDLLAFYKHWDALEEHLTHLSRHRDAEINRSGDATWKAVGGTV